MLRVVFAFGVNFIIEILFRQSLGEAAGFLMQSPLRFALGVLIVFAPVALTLLTRRRGFWTGVACVIWLLLGIANRVVMSMRTMPIGIGDIAVVFSCLSIIPVYLSTFEIILVCVGFAALIAGAVILHKRAKKHALKLKSALITCLCAVLVLGISAHGALASGIVSLKFSNLLEACEQYGYTYCFSAGALRRGIVKPKDYNKASVQAVLENLPGEKAESTPNIIFVQLESFCDVSRFTNLTFSTDPSPVFNSLKKNCPSGYLTVPYIGAGTANVEFEVLTGISLDLFGPGEYPYKSALRTRACESLANILKPLGYSTHVMHNNGGTFYSRNSAFAALGFDDFTSLEYMQDVKYNPLGWATDASLMTPIFDCLESGSNSDLVFAISVQAHGKYPTDEVAQTANTSTGHTNGADEAMLTKEQLDALSIDVSGNISASVKAQYKYYAQQLSEMDAFVGELIDRLSDYPEDTILVVYGDHLPGISLDRSAVSGGIMQSEYVIWSNFPLDIEDRDLFAWELGAHVLKAAGISAGSIARLHESDIEESTYALQLLSYDMLYGESYGGKLEFSDMQMGLLPITVTGIETSPDKTLIRGTNFTPFSHVYAGSKKLATQFIDSETLSVAAGALANAASVHVSQVNTEGTILSESEPYELK